MINLLGIGLALISGVFNNLGALLEKKAVNDYFQEKIRYIQLNVGNADAYMQSPSHIKLNFRQLIFTRTWMLGFFLQFIFGTAGFLGAQKLIGPSLTPALGAIGIIVLVFASCLLQERLKSLDYFGIFLMTSAVILLAFSDLEVNVNETDFLEKWFMIRAAIFTVTVGGLCFFCRLWAKKKDKWEGTLLASLVGLMIAQSNYWISPLTSVGFGLISGKSTNPTLQNHPTVAIVFLVLISATIVIFVNIYAVYARQLAFRAGNAATMVPISHVCSHLSAPIIYSFVFWMRQPKPWSLAFMWSGLLLLGISSFIFGKREALFSEKPKESPIPIPGDSLEEEMERAPMPPSPRSPSFFSFPMTSPSFRLPPLPASPMMSPPTISPTPASPHLSPTPMARSTDRLL